MAKETITPSDVQKVDAEKLAGKGEKKKRARKPIVIPDLDKFEEPSKSQFATVLEASKAYVECVKAANAVAPSFLNNVKRGVSNAISQHLRSLKGDPIARKRQKLEASMMKIKKQLEELGV